MTLPLLTFHKNAGGVRLDLNQLIVSRLLIQANSGGGKSHAVRYMIEQNFGKVQQIVIDPEGEFATLREKYPFLLVGRDGDVPADVRGAKLLARKLLELDLSAVIDLSEYGLPQQRAFVYNFTQAINHLPRELWKDLLLWYDEGHRWAPEVGRSSGKEVQPLTEELATLASAGRKRGFCVIIATQRLSKLNKDIAAECLNKLIGRTSNEDIKRAGDELGLSKLQGKELRSLEPGTFWAYGPAISIDPVLVETGEITTHPPKRGAARAPAPAAPGAIKKVLAELADLPREAVEEARTVQDLQKRNAELTSRIRQAEKGMATKTVEKPVVDQAAIDRAVARALANARKEADTAIERLKRALEAAMKFIVNVSTANFDAAGVDKAELEKAIAAAVDRATRIIDERLSARAAAVRKLRADAEKLVDALGKVIAQPREVTVDVAVTKNEPYSVAAASPSRSRVSRPVVASANGDLKGAKLKIIRSLAELDAIGVTQARREQLGFYAGMSFAGGYGSNTLGAMRTEGLIDYPAGGIIALTDAGRGAAGDVDSPVSLEDLHDRIRQHLSGLEVKIFDALVKLGKGGSVTRDDLGEQIGASFAGGYGSNTLGALRTAGLVEYPTKGSVGPSYLLFPEALS